MSKEILQARFPLTWWVFHYNIDIWLKKLANMVAGASIVGAIYLISWDMGYFTLPFFLSSGMCWMSSAFLTKSRNSVAL